MNVVAAGVGRPKTIGAARFQEIFRCNAPEEFLCIIEKFTRLFTDFLVVENRRITTAQFPRMKKGRPIDVLDQIAHRDVPGNVTEGFRRAAGNSTLAAWAPQTR